MEQPPEQEGMLPAPSNGKETPQLPEEAIGGEEKPTGSEEIPAPDASCAPHLPPIEHLQEDAEEKQCVEDRGSLPGPPVPSSSAGALGLPSEPPQIQPPSREAEEEFYCVKWISWKGERTPVIMQSENGPCPLLAIMNILFLQWKASGVQRGGLGGGWQRAIGLKSPWIRRGRGLGMLLSLSLLPGEAAPAEGGGHG